MSDTQPGSAAVGNADLSVQGGGESASHQNDQGQDHGHDGAGGKVDTTDRSQRSDRGIPSSAYKELKELRRRDKEWERRVADLESRFQAFSRPPGSEQNADIWTDPDKWFETKASGFQKEWELKQSKREAYKFIQSQEGLTSEDEEEIAELMERTGLVSLVEVNPKMAAEIAIERWQKLKGVTAANGNGGSVDPNLRKARAAAVVGSAAPGGRRMFTRTEIDEIARNPIEWAKRRDEIMAALNEGRIK